MGISFEDSFAQTDFTLTHLDSITDNTSLKLDGATGITSFTIGSKTYVAVAGFNSSGVQIIDVTNPTAISAAGSLLDDSTLELLGSYAITSFKIGSSTYVAVAAFGDSGVQIINVTNPMSIYAAGSLADDSTLVLAAASGITSFKIGSSTYLAVASFDESGVQIIDVTNPMSIIATDQIKESDNTALELDSPYGLTSFKIGSSTYVAVAATYDDGVQIINVTNPMSISAAGSITHNSSSYLSGAQEITSFKIGSSTYLAVTGLTVDGVQILNVTNPTMITTADKIRDTDGTALELDDPFAITSFKINSKTYLAVASIEDDGVQTIDVSKPTEISAVDKVDDSEATLALDGANGITSFTIGSKTYLAVTGSEDDGVQILGINRSPNANAGSDKNAILNATVTLDGTGSRDPDGDSNLRYSWVQTSVSPMVIMDDPTSALTTFTAPADPTELVFTLTVSDDTRSDTDDITITITKPVARNIKDMEDTLASAQITGPNQITMAYYEELFTFINSYLNFTITGEDTPRNITGIDGSPSKSATVNIDGEDTDVFVTTLTFDGEPAPLGSTGSMYMQHADHYLAFLQIQDGQN